MTRSECTMPSGKVKRRKRSDIRPTLRQRQALARAIKEARSARQPVKAIDVFGDPRWWKKEGSHAPQ